MSSVKLVKQAKAGGSLPSWVRNLRRDITRNWEVYAILLPIVVYYIIFNYVPMGGALIAFQDWRPGRSWFGPDARWVGLRHFKSFFDSYYFTRTLLNTLTISLSTLIWGFPAPILLAILLK